MAVGGPPAEVEDALAGACELVIRFYPQAEQVLSSCTVVGLPFSIALGPPSSPSIHTYFYQVALWLERGGRIYRPGEPLDAKSHIKCFYVPLILIRDECLRRETPSMVAASLLHEVEHLRRYPTYTRKVLSLVKTGLSREEAILRVLASEEKEVKALLARLANKHAWLADAMRDADLIEHTVALEDAADDKIASWPTLGLVMNIYVHAHRELFRVRDCFGELRELLFLDADMKSRLYARMPDEERAEHERLYGELVEAAKKLEPSWLFKWQFISGAGQEQEASNSICTPASPWRGSAS